MKLSLKQILEEYNNLIDGPMQKEEVYHKFFIKYPIFLPLWTPIDNVIFSKLSLSTQHKVDFAFVTEDSIGVAWHLIEIEKPYHKRFTKKGAPTKELNHGLKQIYDWREWMDINRTQVETYFPFHNKVKNRRLARTHFDLIIGRRENGKDNPYLESQQNSLIKIMSYDRLIENFESPLMKFNEPIKVCSFVDNKIKIISQLKINYSYSIELG